MIQTKFKHGKFRVGTRVRLKPGVTIGRRGIAKIQQFYTDIKGGVRLDRPLAGFFSWNVKDLERMED